MKKILLFLSVLMLLVTGCGKYDEKDIVKELGKKIKKGYMLSGELSIVNNDDVYTYEVEVSFKSPNYYKVVLTNLNNNHTQVILKNDEGVYILTPALNKSFKFQSDWPYNNSQIYLLAALVNDIQSDDDRSFEKVDDGYIIGTKVNYPNNKNLVKQNVYFDKKLNVKKVKIYDGNDSLKMEMSFDDIDYSPTYKKDYFMLDSIMSTFEEMEVFQSMELDDSIYPLFLPENTKLVNSEKVTMDSGDRIIMTFSGDKPFLLVEETSNVLDEFTVIPTYGEPYMFMDTIGVMTDNSLSWSSNGIDYYIVSEVMGKDELVEIAQSITNVPSLK